MSNKDFPHAEALATANKMAINDAMRAGRPAVDEDILFWNDKIKYYHQLLAGWQGFEDRSNV